MRTDNIDYCIEHCDHEYMRQLAREEIDYIKKQLSIYKIGISVRDEHISTLKNRISELEPSKKYLMPGQKCFILID